MDPRIREYVVSEMRVRKWIEELNDEVLDPDLSESLQSGIVLCNTLIKLDKKLVPTVYHGKSEFKLRENVEFFIQGMEEYGVEQTFHSSDLISKRSMFRVVSSLIEFAKLAEKKGCEVKLQPEENFEIPELFSLAETHRKVILLVRTKRKYILNITKY